MSLIESSDELMERISNMDRKTEQSGEADVGKNQLK